MKEPNEQGEVMERSEATWECPVPELHKGKWDHKPFAAHAYQVAEWFIRRYQEEGRKWDRISLHNLCYRAKGWFWVLTEGEEALFPNHIVRHPRGPMIEGLEEELASIQQLRRAKALDAAGIQEEDLLPEWLPMLFSQWETGEYLGEFDPFEGIRNSRGFGTTPRTMNEL
jgi:hypothetical protein